MRAQLFEKTLLDIVKIVDDHVGSPKRTSDRDVLEKIKMIAAKATER